MINRTIPFGYAVQDGKTILHPTEDLIVHRIFRDYLSGASLKAIAESFKNEKIEFMPGRSDWNKNRIKRIIEDVRYIGTNTYPPIIDESIFRQAQTAKGSNRNYVTGKSEISFRLPCPAECAVCGSKMIRRHDARKKASEWWVCDNPDCKAVFEISDEALEQELTGLLNYLIANPDLIICKPAESESPLEIRRLANEINRQLDGVDFDKDQVKSNIFALASEKYNHIDNTPYISQIVKAELEKTALLSAFSKEVFEKIVSKIQFSSRKISLILKNNQIIGKGQY